MFYFNLATALRDKLAKCFHMLAFIDMKLLYEASGRAEIRTPVSTWLDQYVLSVGSTDLRYGSGMGMS